MVKLIATYRKPADPAKFEKWYFEQHAPLAAKMPGLRRMEVARVTGSPMGEAPLALIAEMYFDDMSSLKAAMKSPEGAAAAQDVMKSAGDILQLMFAEVHSG